MTFSDLNSLAKERRPFLFISDFRAKRLVVVPLDELSKHDMEYSIKKPSLISPNNAALQKNPLSFNEYKLKFDRVIEKIKSGDTYLLNLTQATKISTSLSLKEIYAKSNAHYKLRYKDEFVCFSPEKFINIENDVIHTHPMKGTIDASIKNAKNKILNDKKEMAEHVMVVDLLRNDLSMVAKDVKVEKFRYVTEIQAGDKNLLHVSSHISGTLGSDWHERVGDILKSLLPAGSISGAPKRSTVEIIEDVEEYERGFYSGVFGVYDGNSLDSGVMIRFIEKTDKGYVYKSGGGITLDSDAKEEYNELLDKVYIA